MLPAHSLQLLTLLEAASPLPQHHVFFPFPGMACPPSRQVVVWNMKTRSLLLNEGNDREPTGSVNPHGVRCGPATTWQFNCLLCSVPCPSFFATDWIPRALLKKHPTHSYPFQKQVTTRVMNTNGGKQHQLVSLLRMMLKSPKELMGVDSTIDSNWLHPDKGRDNVYINY